GLFHFPPRGTVRDDIRPGLRTIGYKKRVVIAFAVLDDTVAILGLSYDGRDYEAILAGARTRCDLLHARTRSGSQPLIGTPLPRRNCEDLRWLNKSSSDDERAQTSIAVREGQPKPTQIARRCAAVGLPGPEPLEHTRMGDARSKQDCEQR